MTSFIKNPIKVCTTVVSTDGSGNAAKVSDNINGEIYKIVYTKGTVDGATTCVATDTVSGEQLDSKNVNAAAVAYTYPAVALSGASAGDNKWTRFVVSGTLTFTVSSGAASKSFTVYVYYR